MTMLQARHLTKIFSRRASFFGAAPKVRAVDNVSLDIAAGEILALVGESGSGKSTIGRLVLRLIDPTDGTMTFGTSPVDFRRPPDLTYRKDVQIVFQDSRASLNPRRTIYQILGEPMLLHRVITPADARKKVGRLLERVGLAPAAQFIDRYPRQFSGGQLQRIGFARALSLKPKLIVADEPVSALDALVRAQILELVLSLRQTERVAFLFITHDLAVVRNIADRVAVMYLGRIVETGPVEAIFAQPAHPYTQALLSATPIPDPVRARARQHIILTGEIPNSAAIPAGCRFHPRCPSVMAVCHSDDPPTVAVARGVTAACHLHSGVVRDRQQEP